MPPQQHHDAQHYHVAMNGEEDAMKAPLSEAQHLKSTIALCMCTLTHSYLLISVFPYSGFLAIELIEGANEENAGKYAGVIASSFMVGRAVTSFAWGRAADTYGRIFVLYASLGLSCLFTLLFGIAPTFACAVAFRCLLGLGNGMIGTAKTAVSELAGSDAKLETRGMGLVMGMWGWGFLLSPALSGAVAEPARQYPDNPFVQHFSGVLTKYPFLLPNLIGAIFCILTLILVKLWVHETLPKEKLRSPKHIPSDLLSWLSSSLSGIVRKCTSTKEERLPLVQSETLSQDPSEEQEVKEACLKHNESCSFLSTDAVTESPRASLSRGKRPSTQEPTTAAEGRTMRALLRLRNTRRHLIMYWIFSFVAICVDEAFPLFCISKEAGLGISEGLIGKILSASGLIFALCQYFLYAVLVNHCGLYASLHIGSMTAGPIITLIPLSLLLNRNAADGELTTSCFIFLSFVMAFYRIFGSVYFSSITIATNRTVPPSSRATMNGLSMLGGSAAKGIGPAFAGVLVSFSLSSGVFSPHAGAVFVFAVIGILGLMIATGTFIYLKEDCDNDTKQLEEQR